MPISSKPEFVFALTNPGSEKALKLEAGMLRPDWRPGYQRRGFVTFKSDRPFSLDSLEVPLACARRLCLSLGKAATRDLAVSLIEEAVAVGMASGLARSARGFANEGTGQDARATVARASCPPPLIHHARFHERKMQGVHDGDRPARPVIGQLIGTVVELGEAEYWAGLHRHADWLSPDPAGDGGLVMPPESPSRAWLKLEEAVRFFDLRITPADIVVELGCAPGGVALALLERGVPVIGVDPANMADVVRAAAIADRRDAPAGRPWFFHCRKPAALAGKRDLGRGVTWFMSDMNQAPEVVLRELARFCLMAPTIRGALITLKLTDLMQVADQPKWFSALAAGGFKTIRLQQLAVHHKEFALLAMK